MSLDNFVIPQGKKALFVIHEEDWQEDESGKCAFYETAEHRRVLESDIEILEQYPVITISREEKKSGIYLGDKEKIPDDANALLVVDETKHHHRYVAKYCNLKDDTDGEVKEKKKSIFDFLNFILPSPYSLFTMND